MTRLERYNLLCIFGDGRAHTYVNVIFLGVGSMKIPQYKFEKILSRALEYGLVKRVDSVDSVALRTRKQYVIDPACFDFQITSKGDEILRLEQIERKGDYNWYKNFDRTDAARDKFSPGYNGIE
jgi:hypothetical protein